MRSPVLMLLSMLNIGTNQWNSILLFWDEIEQFLGPIWEPIVGPLFDILRVEANRLIILTTIITVCIFVMTITYVVYEVPSVINWLIGGASLTPVSIEPPRASSEREMTTPSSQPKQTPAPTLTPSVLASKSIDVRCIVEEGRDEAVLTVDIENNSEHKIEMVVVDINLPEGIDIMAGSFRIQRIGTIEPGDSQRGTFRLNHRQGSLKEITGHVEFMSSSYEITEVPLPTPEVV